MNTPISLCIPTMNRFDTFLQKNLIKYLKNSFITEIIICDEIGNDSYKIIEYFPNEIKNKKIQVYVNDTILGPFKNKLNVCNKANYDLIALIDSDNYCDEQYFKIITNYISNNKSSQNSIFAPSFAMPNFNYKSLENSVITKKNINEIKNNDKKNVLTTLMNTGNYVLNKNIIKNLNIDNELNNINQSASCDVIFMNTLFFEQYSDFEFHIIKDLHYSHEVHQDSIYLQTHQKHIQFNKEVHNRFALIAK
jgi:predicted DNA-binding ArsR family transcriptional regulator